MLNILYSLAGINKIIKRNKVSHIYLVTSNTLAKKLSWAIKEIGVPKSNIILVPDGESAKEWKELDMLLQKFSKSNLDRNSVVIALGGGTIGDVVGFAASIYLRGIKYIQVPTTLLAQVDSAHGGKTGINFLGFKNQIGTSYLPIATVVDERFIHTLSKEQMIDGLGEIIKAGIINDASILSILKKHTIGSLSKSTDLTKIIKMAINVKTYHVKNDLYDNSMRLLLNFGHTIGHAIELKYNISHGRAVIVGMIKELEVLESLQLSPVQIRQNLLSLLRHLGIEIDLNIKADWNTILHDKKVSGSKIVLPVIEKEGKSRLVELDLIKIKKFI